MWFRRDLRLADNPALLAAAGAGDGSVLPLFVVDPVLFGAAGAPRAAYLVRSLRALDSAMGGALVVRQGRPAEVVTRIATEAGATEVHIAADYGPYGQRRDAAVEKALAGAGIALHRTGSPYAVAPGRIRKADGTPYRVFTPFSKAWRAHGWRPPAGSPGEITWTGATGRDEWPDEPDLGHTRIPEAGERAAAERWAQFENERLRGYGEDRDRMDQPGTSQLSPSLKYGELHPRTLLAALATHRGSGAETYRIELCWREFYADVLHADPRTAWEPLDPATGRIRTDSGALADERFAAWATGRTGFPIVDAGIRQLLAVGWMHNRVRMITASFLVKDLHLPWQRGAAFFLDRLVDGDLASNNHGWQWVAGTGTDAAPYFRVFNPVTQGRTFDPDGAYVRRWIPELSTLDGRAAHEPWDLPGGPPDGYPERIVVHAAERQEALDRYAETRTRPQSRELR
jgi:deoxyribodipyrimidine photo-lyase